MKADGVCLYGVRVRWACFKQIVFVVGDFSFIHVNWFFFDHSRLSH
jgi:hypothetical protein